MKRTIYLVAVYLTFFSCNEYQKALNGDDIAAKFAAGVKKYEEGKYAKANRIFAQIVPNYRGKPQAEKLMFLYADTFYKEREYYLASYQFDRFATSYATSQKAEEAEFLAAKSRYFMSPATGKSQHITKEAIEKLQIFINTHPDSQYVAEANQLVRELDLKLEEKAYNIAYQYYKTVSYTRDYNAAIKAFDNFIFNFPGSTLREDALFYRLASAYNLAINSVEWKKKDRLETAKNYYQNFALNYKDSKYIEKTDEMIAKIEKELNNYSTKS